MTLHILEEAKLKLLERVLIEKSRDLEKKQAKTRLDYALLLGTVKECREIQSKLSELKANRAGLSEEDIDAIIAQYRLLENMPNFELFMEKDKEKNDVK